MFVIVHLQALATKLLYKPAFGFLVASFIFYNIFFKFLEKGLNISLKP